METLELGPPSKMHSFKELYHSTLLASYPPPLRVRSGLFPFTLVFFCKIRQHILSVLSTVERIRKTLTLKFNFVLYPYSITLCLNVNLSIILRCFYWSTYRVFCDCAIKFNCVPAPLSMFLKNFDDLTSFF